MSASLRLSVLSRHVFPEEGMSNGTLHRNFADEDRVMAVPTSTSSDQRPLPGGGAGQLTVIDDRTGKKYKLPISAGGTIKGADLAQIRAGGDGNPLRLYDPGYVNTVPCASRVCFIDGGKGVLRYRGIPIEQLAESSSFEESAFLLMTGHLPTADEFVRFKKSLARNAHLPQAVVDAIDALPRDAHPMAVMMVGVTALGTFHPEANPALAGSGVYGDRSLRAAMALRVLGAAPSIAAMAYHKRSGGRASQPNETLGFAENFLYMLDSKGNVTYRPNAQLARAIDVMFVLHADHELNCSTAAMRHLASSGVDVFSASVGALGALYGPLHGGANEAVLRMLERIGSVDNVPAFIEGVKQRQEKLFGFGHRVYKNYDPRAKIIRKVADQVFAIAGGDRLIEVAERLERIALSDPFFVERKLYPNVDFYSGLVYRAMGFSPEFFTVLFAVPRFAGWLSHWMEALDDADAKIMRPQQDYRGPWLERYVRMEDRVKALHVPPNKEHIRKTAGVNWV